jgi:hypothetical protein
MDKKKNFFCKELNLFQNNFCEEDEEGDHRWNIEPDLKVQKEMDEWNSNLLH